MQFSALGKRYFFGENLWVPISITPHHQASDCVFRSFAAFYIFTCWKTLCNIFESVETFVNIYRLNINYVVEVLNEVTIALRMRSPTYADYT